MGYDNLNMIGAGNDFFLIAISGDTPTIAKNATVLWGTNQIESSDISGVPKLHNMVFNLDNISNSAELGKLLKDYITEDAGADVQEVPFENGAKWNSSSSGSDPNLVGVWRGGVVNGYRLHFIFPCKITSNTGNISTTGGQATRRTFEVSAVKATKTITLPDKSVANVSGDTFYNPAYVTLPEATPSAMPAVATIAIGTSCVEAWLPKETA
jgi:hypothetical protein